MNFSFRQGFTPKNVIPPLRISLNVKPGIHKLALENTQDRASRCIRLYTKWHVFIATRLEPFFLAAALPPGCSPASRRRPPCRASRRCRSSGCCRRRSSERWLDLAPGPRAVAYGSSLDTLRLSLRHLMYKMPGASLVIRLGISGRPGLC